MEPMVYGKKLSDRIFGAFNELISAQSALHMEPMPIKPSKDMEYPENAFLSNTDHWVNHSMLHIRAASNLLREVIERLNVAERKLIENGIEI